MLSMNERSYVLHHVLTSRGDELRSLQNSAIKQNYNQKGYENAQLWVARQIGKWFNHKTLPSENVGVSW